MKSKTFGVIPKKRSKKLYIIVVQHIRKVSIVIFFYMLLGSKLINYVSFIIKISQLAKKRSKNYILS